MDEPERPPLGELGEHDGEVSTGERCVHYPPPGADLRQWSRHHDEKAALAAEAQAAWEKARKDAEAWRERVEGSGMTESAEDGSTSGGH